MYYYGYRGNSLYWLRSFSSNRFYFVENNQKRSSSLDVKIGVPQGSTLGPLLFILYNNDLNKSVSMQKSIHFTDDTTLYWEINPYTDYTSLKNSELAQVQTWINANKLSLSVQKTSYMIILNRNQTENVFFCLSGHF